ncbi:hypothetical protein DDB_G0291189 [Dictyostelium discoideum AX4]|uniref:Transmembrane protein n=1 Tax=Dictyostelium discoideum TaxID=44689 RepID=Q54F17_DICDI|nr:hypothetical protein DDB_G0291189 [Dictyostelium discoideum AX4]EAL61878.1 hypothetical protein DDB_G0291189 [Dictyostelium discoideum AX4]|eukprot:XP_635373.1 hypothetical protein DDB_G0291189 [Dictyostelium discoideum AX4]
MELLSLQVNSEPIKYKEYCHSHFNGFSTEFPIYLSSVIDPCEYYEIIKSINNNSIRKLDTPVLNSMLTTGSVFSYLFIGLPVLTGALIGNKVIYNKYNKKLKKDLVKTLNEINNNPKIMEKNIQFTLIENKKTKRSIEYNIQLNCYVTDSQKKLIQQQKNIIAQQQIEQQIQQQTRQQQQQQQNDRRNSIRNLTRNATNPSGMNQSPLGRVNKRLIDGIPIDSGSPFNHKK